MKAIHRKLLRDLWRMKEQAVAVALVMACGIATFVMALSMLDSLHSAADAYYERNRFAHVFAHARRAPETMAHRLEAITGVTEVDTRIVDRVLLDVPGMREPASAAIVSLPPPDRRGLNELHLLEGRLPEGRHGRELADPRPGWDDASGRVLRPSGGRRQGPVARIEPGGTPWPRPL